MSVNLCINCVHCLPSEHSFPTNYTYARCGFDRPMSLVTGEPLPPSDLPYCDMSRRITGHCGKDGTKYQPIEPLSIPPLTHEDTQELLSGDPRHE